MKLNRRRLPRFPLALLLAMAIPLAGCGQSGLPDMVPIRGEVVYNGQPVSGGRVVYLPKDPAIGRQANGPIKPDGTFVLTTQKAGDGAMHGEYHIVVFPASTDLSREARSGEATDAEEQPDDAPSIPEKYSHQATSGLSDTVDGSHSGYKRIEL